ncbi:MAG: winged helix-turn-helix transcriptional regulator [Candidatus Thorarchaeota archaeon]|jgi:DNA-binding Lrp family transcriptional regulator
MDKTDRRILQELQRNCRLSYEKLSRELGITGNSVKRRVKKLIDERVIDSFVLRLSFAMVGAEPMLTLVGLDGTQNDEDIIEKIGMHPFVNRVGFDSHGWLVVWIEYIGIEGLSEISSYIRSLDGVEDVELNPLPSRNRGKKMDFTKTQLRVMRVLVDDPRMSVSQLAKEAGITTKRARKVLKELEDSEAVTFGARINVNAGSSTRFVLRLSWDEKKISSEDIEKYAREKYPSMYEGAHVSASNPRMFAMFTAEHIRIAESVARDIQKLPSVDHEITVIPYPARIFTGIRESALLDMIEKEDI